MKFDVILNSSVLKTGYGQTIQTGNRSGNSSNYWIKHVTKSVGTG